MDKKQIFEKVKSILAEKGVESESIKLESNIFDDFGFDSLDQVEMIIELEKRFHISIEDEVAENIKTVSEMIDAVSTQLVVR